MFTFKSFDGESMRGDVLRGNYLTNGNLAILFRKEDDTDDYTFAISINVSEKMPDGCALIDVNNLPQEEIEDFLESNHLAEPTGDFVQSGFVVYPLYRFYPEALDKMKELK